MSSPYATGGGGPFLEAKIAASALVAILCRKSFRGLAQGHATHIASQRKDFNEPLDDLIIKGVNPAGHPTSLSLQITNQLSFTAKNEKWRDIIFRAWETFSGDNFDPRFDRVGAGIGVYTKAADDDYQAVITWARESSDGDDFRARIEKDGVSNEQKRMFVSSIRLILSDNLNRDATNDELWRFLKCLVIIHFDFQSGDASRETTNCIDRLKDMSEGQNTTSALHIWLYLLDKITSLIPSGGSASRSTLVDDLTTAGLLSNNGNNPVQSDNGGELSSLESQQRNLIQAIAQHTTTLNSLSFLDEARQLTATYAPISIISVFGPNSSEERHPEKQHTVDEVVGDLLYGNHIIEGPAGSGKSTLLRWLTHCAAERLLDDANKTALDEERIPILLEARSIMNIDRPFTESICQAVNQGFSLCLSRSLDQEFFVPHSANGHRRWMIFLDGVDELSSPSLSARFFNALSSMKSQFGDAFQFVLASRPGVFSISEKTGFQRWRLLPLSENEQYEIVSRYLGSEAKIAAFKNQAASADISNVLETPLFCEIAAAVFSQNGSVPTDKRSLIEAYVYAHFQKPSLAAMDQEKLSALHIRISDPKFDFSMIDNSILDTCDALTLPKLAQLKAVIEVIRRIGLAEVSQNRFDFRHDLIRSYFFAQHLMQCSEPNKDVWRTVDPFNVGWPAVTFLCQFWDQTGKDISDAVDALLGFGNEGVICAAEAVETCRHISSDTIDDICERIFREMFSGGTKIWHAEVLTKLSREYEIVAEKLEDKVYSDHDFMNSRLECAECLVHSGRMEEGIDALNYIAQESSEYDWNRIRAATLLCEQGKVDTGLAVLRIMIKEADESFKKLDAAASLLKFSSEKVDQAVVEDLSASLRNEIDNLDVNDAKHLMSLGENGLAHDILRAKATISDTISRGASIFSSEVDAANLLAQKFDRDEGLHLLSEITKSACSPIGTRVDALHHIIDLGFVSEAKELFDDIPQHGLDEYGSLDWSFLSLLVKLNCKSEARECALSFLDHSFQQSRYELKFRIHDLQKALTRDEIKERLLAEINRKFSPTLAICLAQLGARNLAIEALCHQLASSSVELRVDSAKALCEIGEAETGIAALMKVTQDFANAFEHRLMAANALSRAGFYKEADEAHHGLLSDVKISITDRCKAADYFSDDGVNQPEVVWEKLLPLFFDKNTTVEEMCLVAKNLLYLQYHDEWGDYCPTILHDHLVTILKDPNICTLNAWKIVDTLADSEVKYDNIPGLLELARQPDIPIVTRIKTLGMFRRGTGGREIDEILFSLAEEPGVSFYESVKALQAVTIMKDQSDVRIMEIVQQSDLPAKWRLTAASDGFWATSINFDATQCIMRDKSVAIHIRIAAFQNMLRAHWDGDTRELLGYLSSTESLSCQEHLNIAELALKLEHTDVAKQHLDNALRDQPHSIQEINEIAKICLKLGNPDLAAKYLNLVTEYDDIVLREIEDDLDIRESARLLARIGALPCAVNLMRRYAEYASWYSTEEVLETLVELGGEAELMPIALELATSLEKELFNSDNRHLGMLWGAAKYFLSKGWITKLDAFEAVALNQSQSVCDRAEACSIVVNYADKFGDVAKAGTGRNILQRLASDQSFSLDDRVRLVQLLKESKLPILADKLTGELIELPDLTAKDRRTLARYFQSIGSLNQAKQVLGANDQDVEATEWVSPLDDRVIKELEGETRHRAILAKQVFDETCPTFDRMFPARDLVLEHGSREALQFVKETASGSNLEPDLRLEAALALEDMGFRELPRKVLADVETARDLDDFWIGDTFLRFGNKDKARIFLERSIATAPKGYRDQIARSLAYLNAPDLLARLNSELGTNNEPDVQQVAE